MNHVSEETLNLYLDEQLDPAECAQVEQHLASCAICQAEFAQLQQLFEVLQELQAEPITIDLRDAVINTITPAPWSRSSIGLLLLQILLSLGLILWLGPQLGQWLFNGLATLPQPELNQILAELIAQRSAQLSALQQLWSTLLNAHWWPVSPLTPLQTGVSLAMATLGWLLANRSLLRQSAGHQPELEEHHP